MADDTSVGPSPRPRGAPREVDLAVSRSLITMHASSGFSHDATCRASPIPPAARWLLALVRVRGQWSCGASP